MQSAVQQFSTLGDRNMFCTWYPPEHILFYRTPTTSQNKGVWIIIADNVGVYVLVHSQRRFLQGIAIQFTFTHFQWINCSFMESIPHLHELTSLVMQSMKNDKQSIHHCDPYNGMHIWHLDATTITLCSMSSLKLVYFPHFIPYCLLPHCNPPSPLPPQWPLPPQEPPHPQYPSLSNNCSHWQYRLQMWDLLRVKEKEQLSWIVGRFKETVNYRLIYKRERRNSYMPTSRAGAWGQASVPRLRLILSAGAGRADWGQTTLVGAGEVTGGSKPPASCPSPPVLKTKEATRPNCGSTAH